MATFNSISMVSSPAFKPRSTCTFRTTQDTTFPCNRDRWSSCKPSRKVVTAQLRVPDDDKARLDVMKEKLWQSLPDSANDFEWKKAGDVLQHQLLSVGRKALVWLFVAWFGFSSISDAIYSIFVNKELLMPLGLFAGCLLADFVKETSREFFRHSASTALDRHLVGIGCFCVLLRLISLLLPVQGRVFLLHVANGGLLQVLWLWRSSLMEKILVPINKPFIMTHGHCKRI